VTMGIISILIIAPIYARMPLVEMDLYNLENNAMMQMQRILMLVPLFAKMPSAEMDLNRQERPVTMEIP